MEISEAFTRELRGICRGEIRLSEPMKYHTSFRIGGPADVLVIPKDLDDLVAVRVFLWEAGVDPFVMGNGTNLLVLDCGIRGIVIKLGGTLMGLERKGTSAVVGAGFPLPALSKWAAREGLCGLEFACGIPGSVGGAVLMNAGAYGSSMEDIVDAVKVLRENGGVETWPRERIGFRRRGTAIDGSAGIIVEAELDLVDGEREAIERKIEELLAERRSKQPLTEPSAGCVFRNPEGGGAGRFIDWAELKGVSCGGAKVSEKHANFIVNRGGATAKDVLALMEQVRAKVEERFGVILEPEIKVVGGFDIRR